MLQQDTNGKSMIGKIMPQQDTIILVGYKWENNATTRFYW